MAPHNDEAHVPLVRHGSDEWGGNPSRSATNPFGGGDTSNGNNGGISALWMNRILTIITLVALVIVSIYFQSETTQLANLLQTDEAKISQLEATVKSQESVIQRFNQSVSNSDVLQKLKQIEADLDHTQQDLRHQLDTTMTQVGEKLEQTLKTLDQTVKQAESEIQTQVESVKEDFQQYVISTQDQFSMENSFMVYQLAGTFTLLSCLISMWHMTAHLRKLKQPVIQRKILAILWMSPVYAVTSWFSLVFPAAEGYLAIIKDAYEAYIIYQVSITKLEGKGYLSRNALLTVERFALSCPVFIILHCRYGQR